MNVDFYIVDNQYLDYLREYDERVSENHEGSNERPFVAIFANCLGVDYLIPMTHIHKKKNLGTFPLTIDHTTHVEKLGTLLINNMIPFKENVATQLVVESVLDEKYKVLLRKQWSILRDEQFQIRLEKAVKQSYYFQTNSKNISNPLHINFIDYKRVELASKRYVK